MSIITNEDSATAAEYVLGLLDPGSQAQAAARVATDADFAAEVSAWEDRLSPLLDGRDEAPPAALWAGIDEIGRASCRERVLVAV